MFFFKSIFWSLLFGLFSSVLDCISEPLNEDEDEDDLSPIPPLKDDKVNSEPNETIGQGFSI